MGRYAEKLLSILMLRQHGVSVTICFELYLILIIRQLYSCSLFDKPWQPPNRPSFRIHQDMPVLIQGHLR